MPQTPCLFAPADDRNAGDGGIALAGKCQVQGASLSEKKRRACASVSTARAIHSRAVGNLHCHDLPRIRTFASIITSEHGGTETAEKTTVEAARAVHWGAVVSARSGETEDVTIVHLAVGWGVLQLKVGSFSRSERMAKWNEALRIEEALDGRARFAGAEPWRGWVAT